MFRKTLLKESLVATVVTLFITFLVGFLPYSLEFAKGLHQGFSDFDIYDLHYSSRNKENLIDNKNIVIVQIGDDRLQIARQVERIRQFGPRVIAIDATFEEPKDSVIDEELRKTLQHHSDVVLAYGFNDKKEVVRNIFMSNGQEESIGYIDFSKNPDYTVIRTYSPFLIADGRGEEAFTTRILHKADPKSYELLRKRKNRVEIINYIGNLSNFLNFSRLDFENSDSSQLDAALRGRIVLLGYFVGQGPLVMDDLRYTPLNPQVAGKGFPDMYGVVVHANILSMAIKGSYAHLAPKSISFLFAFVITLFLNWFFISRYYKKTHPSHGWLMLLQFLLILVALFIFLMLFNLWLYKVRLEPIIIAMVISLELLGLYKSLALWLHKKYHYQTVFTHKRII